MLEIKSKNIIITSYGAHSGGTQIADDENRELVDIISIISYICENEANNPRYE